MNGQRNRSKSGRRHDFDFVPGESWKERHRRRIHATLMNAKRRKFKKLRAPEKAELAAERAAREKAAALKRFAAFLECPEVLAYAMLRRKWHPLPDLTASLCRDMLESIEYLSPKTKVKK